MPLRLFSGTDIAQTVRRSSCIASTVLGPSAKCRARRFVCKSIAGCRSDRTLPNGESRSQPRPNWVPLGSPPLQLGVATVTTAVRRARRLDIKQ